MRDRREFLVALSAALVAEPMWAGAAEAQPAQGAQLALSHRARAVAAGEVLLVSAALPPSFQAVSVEGQAAGESVMFAPVSAALWHGLVGVDLEAALSNVSLRVTARDASGGTLSGQLSLDVQPKSFRTRRLDVPPQFVTPPKRVQARIAREQATMREVLATVSPNALWRGAWLRPVPGISLSSFGVRSVFNGQARAPHTGTDFRAPAGTPLRAPASGVVVLAEGHYFPGNQIVLDHGLGLFSLFAHLSTFAVAKGDRVARGAVLGATGATGRVTGPHLHWAVRLGSARVDAEALLDVTSELGDEPV